MFSWCLNPALSAALFSLLLPIHVYAEVATYIYVQGNEQARAFASPRRQRERERAFEFIVIYRGV